MHVQNVVGVYDLKPFIGEQKSQLSEQLLTKVVGMTLNGSMNGKAFKVLLNIF